MNFVDKFLVRLADPAGRAALFDEVALGHILTAAYGEGLTVTPPFRPIFDVVRLGVSATSPVSIEGVWQPTGSSERVEARFQAIGLGPTTAEVDAYWSGSVVGTVTPGTGKITQVTATWPDLTSVDAEIAANNGGALPTNPSVLESQRRQRVRDKLKTQRDQPDTLSEAWLESWLQQLGLSKVGELLVQATSTAGLTVTFQEGPIMPAAQKALPMAAALLVRDAPVSVAGLLRLTRTAREYLEAQGLGREADPPLRLKHKLVFLWVVPETVFNDPDWPGANNAARRTAAGTWLAREGIGLVTVP